MPQSKASFIGKPVEGLPLKDRLALSGRWVALQLYSPLTLPLRNIEAVGDDARACVEALRVRGLNPARYHFEVLAPPFGS